MSDADQARAAKHLAGIDQSLKSLVKIFEVLNQNFVEFAKRFKEWDEAYITDPPHNPTSNPDQLSLEDENGQG